MAFSDDMFDVGQELLIELGQSISVTRDVIGAYAPATGTVTDSSDTTYSGYGYPTNYRTNQIDGTLVKADDTLLIFSSSTVPLVNDIFTVGSKVLTAINVQKITAQGNNVLFKVQLRQ